MIFSPLAINARDGFEEGFKNGGISNIVNSFDKSNTNNSVTGFSNITSPQESNGALFGGNIEFRFNNAATQFKPWVDWKMPSISGGCNGFSMNGGFLQGLELEDIKEQLGNASSAIIYGIFIGLVNSIPTIEHVFSKIKEFVQNIQNLLRNACNFSSNITQNAMKSTGVPQKLQSSVDKFGDYIDSSVDKLSDKFNKIFKGDSSSVSGKEKEANSIAAGEQYSPFFVVRGAAKIIEPVLFKNSVTSNSVKNFIPITHQTIDATQPLYLQYLFAVNLFGDIGISTEMDAFLTKKGSFLPEFIAQGKFDDDSKTKPLAKEIAQIMKTGSSSLVNYFKPNYLPPKGARSALINDILRGNETNILELYPVEVIYGQTRTPAGKIMTLLSTVRMESKPIKIPWRGLIESSKELIQCRLQGGGNACKKPIEGVALILPDVYKMINDVIDLNAKSHSAKTNNQHTISQSQIDDLVGVLSKVNAYFYAKYMLNNILDIKRKSSIDKVGENSPEALDNDEKLINGYLESIASQTFGDMDKIRKYRSIFKELEEILQKSRTKK